MPKQLLSRGDAWHCYWHDTGPKIGPRKSFNRPKNRFALSISAQWLALWFAMQLSRLSWNFHGTNIFPNQLNHAFGSWGIQPDTFWHPIGPNNFSPGADFCHFLSSVQRFYSLLCSPKYSLLCSPTLFLRFGQSNWLQEPIPGRKCNPGHARKVSVQLGSWQKSRRETGVSKYSLLCRPKNILSYAGQARKCFKHRS